jgi:hypothetical protein
MSSKGTQQQQDQADKNSLDQRCSVSTGDSNSNNSSLNNAENAKSTLSSSLQASEQPKALNHTIQIGGKGNKQHGRLFV